MNTTLLKSLLIMYENKRNKKMEEAEKRKEELYKNPFLAFLGWVFEAVKVKRDAKDINAVKSSLK